MGGAGVAEIGIQWKRMATLGIELTKLSHNVQYNVLVRDIAFIDIQWLHFCIIFTKPAVNFMSDFLYPWPGNLNRFAYVLEPNFSESAMIYFLCSVFSHNAWTWTIMQNMFDVSECYTD